MQRLSPFNGNILDYIQFMQVRMCKLYFRNVEAYSTICNLFYKNESNVTLSILLDTIYFEI